MKITFLGGDDRIRTAYEILKERFEVSSVGLFNKDNANTVDADILVFPVPTTRDGITVNCPLTQRKILLSDIVTKDNALILTCGYEFKNKRSLDYGKLDEFAILNAIPTAEGAIAEAILWTKSTLFDSKILVTGYGRVSKVLCDRLSALCPRSTVSARKESDFALIKSKGLKYIASDCVNESAAEFDIIFNTLDVELFKNGDTLKNTALFDLATKGCIKDTNGIFYKKLPSLPAKTAPHTAGKIIAETVERIVRREFI